MPLSPNSFCIIAAAGRGTRFSSERPKQFVELLGAPLLAHTVAGAIACECFQKIVVVLPKDEEPPRWLFQDERIATAPGGATRQESVWSGLEAVKAWAQPEDWIWIHDGARPMIGRPLVQAMVDSIRKDGADDGYVPVLPSVDTLKEVDATGRILRTLNREKVWRAQTPQVFRFSALIEALVCCKEQKLDMTDESSAMEFTGRSVRVLTGFPWNVKLTVQDDLPLLEQYLAKEIREGRRVDPRQWTKTTQG